MRGTQGVDPRVCGGAPVTDLLDPRETGRSPRVRGSPRVTEAQAEEQGSIPACAGEPKAPTSEARGSRVDPRVCGGAHRSPAPCISSQGRSPRVRGSRRRGGGHGRREGSIPACAGEPPPRGLNRGHPGVDPRVCGGARHRNDVIGVDGGRSPRVRGSHAELDRGPGEFGSIPACAGEPVGALAVLHDDRVDPRVCGGAVDATGPQRGGSGRSPRVRGSPGAGWARPCASGSIPACAGEPAPPRSTPEPRRVDPRVCGGAVKAPRSRPSHKGRSPRVRGSLAAGGARSRELGSIPACAGEPPTGAAGPSRGRVDPRVCGGAYALSTVPSCTRGRSPRVRGSPVRGGVGDAREGSIPACAGEPPAPRRRSRPVRVDPRVCGGARTPWPAVTSRTGRSPRVRGSRRLRHGPRRPPGSIPACAGEPRPSRARAWRRRVDPRVCGGARCRHHAPHSARGRSPRVRGSLFMGPAAAGVGGSIPACAGEPGTARSVWRR